MKNIELLQRVFPFTKLKLTIRGNRELVLEHRALLRSTRLTFPLGQLVPAPVHHRSVPGRWILFTIVAFAIFMGAVLIGWASQGPGELFGILLLGGIFAACLVNTVKLSSNLLHYKDAGTGAILFAMYRTKPTTKQVDNFVNALQDRIESFRSPSGASPEELAVLYRKHLDYLVEAEVLLPEEYDQIVRRLEAGVLKKKVVELVR